VYSNESDVHTFARPSGNSSAAFIRRLRKIVRTSTRACGLVRSSGRAGIWTRLTFFDVPPGRHVDAGHGVQAHGKTAPGAILAAFTTAMSGLIGGGITRGVAQEFQVGETRRAFVLLRARRRSPWRRRAVSICGASFTS
jgi:hypothetical protein